ncbi:leucyl aminopeptidase family protein [Arenimonas sp. MALMAid1274]|uniref:leucyl aminopeptidase family protein n=1 Tax=Arenimonas sp. MALMAid1274 TaxID=3411630 RepID=UPI003BA17339
MSLPSCFASPDQAEGALPLRLVDRAGFEAWRSGQTPAVQAWLQAHGFLPQSGAPLLVPGPDGHPAFALAGVSDARDPLALAHLPSLLPPGTYRLVQDGVALEPGQALLGWGLGAYRFDRYAKPPRAPARLVLEAAGVEDSEAFALLKASTLVRDLVNTPTEHMGPAELEAVAARLAQAYGGTLTVVAGDELLAQNFPAIHAVGRASHRAPRLIQVDWGDPAHPRLAIVGKGVCFDTGGLDIKPADGMRNMKKDMGGAAHALGLAQLVMAMKLPVRLQLLVPAVENAIGPNAFRPGEVLSTRQGLSVEVDNTDAEGRLVLCDALAFAAEARPALIMDFATLTGAARIALGPDLPALFCNDEALAADYLAAGERMRDPLWRMPLWRPYLGYLKSGIADLANSGPSRMAGCITAALYLERFIPEGQAWSHVDVYSWNDSDRPGKPAGGEAQGLRAAWSLLKSRHP